jgi:hypothetical protein
MRNSSFWPRGMPPAIDMNLATLTPRLPFGSQLQAQARRWGWPGLLGAFSLAAALALAAIWLPSLQRQALQLSEAADAAELRAAQLSKRQAQREPGLSAPERFRAGFPAPQTRQDRVAALLALAGSHGLQPARSEFQLESRPEIGLLRYRATLPLTGSYEQLRQFIDEAQGNDPALSLDRLRLRRASANATQVEAETAWSFYMQAASAVPPSP